MNIDLCKVKEYLSIDKIKLYPDNPRTITRERLDSLKKSILKKGFYQPLLIWKRNNVVLSGNHRLIAVKELIGEGYSFNTQDKEQVLPVVIEDCSQEIAEAILFEANNSYASWIEDKLLSALEKVDEVALEDYGFSPEQLDSMIKKASSDVEKELEKAKKEIGDNIIPEKISLVDRNEDEIPKEPRKTVVREGDVWALGEHRIVCGDSTMIDNFVKLFKKKKASCVFTAPPIDKKGVAQDVLTNCFTNTDGFIFWNVSYNANDRNSFIKDIFPWIDSLHETICWERIKSNTMPYGLTRAFEFIFCFKNTDKRKFLGQPNTTNFNLWKISSVGSTDDGAFPVLLPQTAINLSTDEGDIVLDPFLGTGTTIVACEKSKRVCYGLEISPYNCDIAIERWEKFTGRDAVHHKTGKTYKEYKV